MAICECFALALTVQQSRLVPIYFTMPSGSDRTSSESAASSRQAVRGWGFGWSEPHFELFMPVVSSIHRGDLHRCCGRGKGDTPLLLTRLRTAAPRVR
jgi:hypothetical protein